MPSRTATIELNFRLRLDKARAKAIRATFRPKLPDWKIEEMRVLYESGLVTQGLLAWIYGVTHQYVRSVVTYSIRYKSPEGLP